MSLGDVFSGSRQVIPRWHTYSLARWLGVTISSNAQIPPPQLSSDFPEKIQSWKDERTLLHASDLVGNSLVLNYFDSKDAIAAANFILSNQAHATRAILEVAETFLRLAHKKGFPLPHIILPEQTARFHEVIASLKKRVREYPRNPILWMDLAFYYSAIGQTLPAQNAVKVALSLNSENRYLLRSGSRFFMHLDSPDVALDILRRSDIGRHDPWLIAAEIAISDTLDRPSKMIKAARDIIERRTHSKFHLSELASALGTIELIKGSRRKGKKLFNLALEDPTENTLAQAIYLESLLGDTVRQIDPQKLANSFEAETRLKFYQMEDYRGALDAAKKWFAYQPFSSRPAVSGSYIAGVALEDYEDSAKIAQMGLLSSPNDVMLRNNLAFSLAYLGRALEAKEELSHLRDSQLSKTELNIITATRALVEFRSENHVEGRRLYESAVAGFKQLKDLHLETKARFFWAREELRSNSNLARPLLEEALKVARSLGIKELLVKNTTPKDAEPLFRSI